MLECAEFGISDFCIKKEVLIDEDYGKDRYVHNNNTKVKGKL